MVTPAIRLGCGRTTITTSHKNSYGVFTTSKIIRDYFLSRWGLNKLRLLISFLVQCTLLQDSIEKNRPVRGSKKKRPAEGQKRPAEGMVHQPTEKVLDT